MRDDLGLDSFSISGFFLACLGARAVWAAGLLKAVIGLFGYCVGFLFDLFGCRAVWAAGLLKAVTGLFGYLCRVSF